MISEVDRHPWIMITDIETIDHLTIDMNQTTVVEAVIMMNAHHSVAVSIAEALIWTDFDPQMALMEM